MAARSLYLLLLMVPTAYSQTAAEIVAAVSDRYEELEKACSMTVTVQRSGRTDYREDGLELTLKGNQARLTSTNNPKPITWMIDEEFASLSNPAFHIFQRSELDSPEANKIRDTVAATKELLVTRFIKLNDIHTTLTLHGEQDLRTGRSQHHCVRIKIDSPSKDATEEIWVESSTHLVWKLVKTWKGTARDQTITWRQIEIGAPASRSR